jgi:hypothetical protein
VYIAIIYKQIGVASRASLPWPTGPRRALALVEHATSPWSHCRNLAEIRRFQRKRLGAATGMAGPVRRISKRRAVPSQVDDQIAGDESIGPPPA